MKRYEIDGFVYVVDEATGQVEYTNNPDYFSNIIAA